MIDIFKRHNLTKMAAFLPAGKLAASQIGDKWERLDGIQHGQRPDQTGFEILEEAAGFAGCVQPGRAGRRRSS